MLSLWLFSFWVSFTPVVSSPVLEVVDPLSANFSTIFPFLFLKTRLSFPFYFLPNCSARSITSCVVGHGLNSWRSNLFPVFKAIILYPL